MPRPVRGVERATGIAPCGSGRPSGARRVMDRPAGKDVPVTAPLSDDLKKLLDAPVFVIGATVQPDGSPQVSPVWVKRDGDDLLISTTVGRRKEANLRRDPRVSVVIQPF